MRRYRVFIGRGEQSIPNRHLLEGRAPLACVDAPVSQQPQHSSVHFYTVRICVDPGFCTTVFGTTTAAVNQGVKAIPLYGTVSYVAGIRIAVMRILL